MTRSAEPLTLDDLDTWRPGPPEDERETLRPPGDLPPEESAESSQSGAVTIRRVGAIRDTLTPVSGERRRSMIVPRMDIYENSKNILVVAELPGVQDGEVSLEVRRDQMFLKAQRSTIPPRRDGTVDYRRSFPIPKDIDLDEVSATLENGELRVKIPKLPMPPRRVDVCHYEEIEPDDIELAETG